MESYALLIAATLSAGTVLAIAALGLLINEKAGIVNLGAEGMMLCAAIAGFATVVHTGSDLLGFAAGMGAGALLALIFGALVIGLNTNQYATGLALSLFGVGFSAFVGTGYVQAKLPERMRFEVPGLVDLPFVGPALFKQHPMVYLVILFTIALIWFLERSRAGLVLRAVGESPQSAHALGYSVRIIRLGAVVTGGALCGLAGAYISIIYTPLWVEGMIAGKGWIALALTTFATWRPMRVLMALPTSGRFSVTCSTPSSWDCNRSVSKSCERAMGFESDRCSIGCVLLSAIHMQHRTAQVTAHGG